MKGYRTYIVAILMALFGVLQMTDWNKFFDDPKAGAVALGAAAIMAIMRTVTTTPPAKATEPPQ